MSDIRKDPVPLHLSMLRMAARRMGEGGGFVLLAVLLGASIVIIGTSRSMASVLITAIIIAVCCLAVFARAMDAQGQKAMARLMRPAAQTNEELQLRRRFGLRDRFGRGMGDTRRFRHDRTVGFRRRRLCV